MIFSIDVEDWSQSVLNTNNPVTNRVYDNTLRLIDILGEHNHKATFFTLGNVAQKHPELLRLGMRLLLTDITINQYLI